MRYQYRLETNLKLNTQKYKLKKQLLHRPLRMFFIGVFFMKEPLFCELHIKNVVLLFQISRKVIFLLHLRFRTLPLCFRV